jgi:hypothetical protein
VEWPATQLLTQRGPNVARCSDGETDTEPAAVARTSSRFHRAIHQELLTRRIERNEVGAASVAFTDCSQVGGNRVGRDSLESFFQHD